MIGAIVKDNIVVDLIVVSEDKITKMTEVFGCEIVDARPYGLVIGDLRTSKGWTRNADGEQVILTKQDVPNYDSYEVAVQKMKEAEEQAAYSEEALAETNEILSIILEGGIE